MPRLVRILDDYGVDGLYDDLGYLPLRRGTPAPDEILAFEESRRHDGALTDLLEIIYSEIKRRGGVFKIHYSATDAPATSTKLYDYLWAGESVRDADALREAVKNYTPYVVPCLDMSRARIAREDELYLHAIPYMQFPLLLAGRPFTGQRAAVPGIQYASDQDFWKTHCRRIWEHHQKNPKGPHSYGWWDSCPGRLEARPTCFRWLKLYRPMVESGTAAYIEIAESDLLNAALPARVVASVFANRDLYLVLANYSAAEATINTAHSYHDCASAGRRGTRWVVQPRTLLILQREDQNA